MRQVASSVLLSAAGLCSLGAESLATSGGAGVLTYAVLDVTVIDVEAGAARAGQTVLVSGDRIARVGSVDEVAVPSGARVIDGRGLFLMPGVCDAHVHFVDPQVFGRAMVANGVLFARDTGLPTPDALVIRADLRDGSLVGPEMVVTGAVLDGEPPIIPAISIGLPSPEAARAAVRQQAAAGVDMIKVYSRLDRDTLFAILDEANALGLKVVGHVPESVSIREAAAAGLASSEHFFGFERLIEELLGQPVRREYVGMGADAGYLLRLSDVDAQTLAQALGQLRESGLTVCPTVNVFKVGVHTSQFQSDDFPLAEYISPTVLETWRSLWSEQGDLPDILWQAWARFVVELHAAGIPLMVGTDLCTPGSLPGFSVHDEMEIWQDAGIPAADVLRSATLVPARFMGLDGRLGAIAERKTASMVLLRANPLADIRNAREIEAVFLRGTYYDRAALDGLLGEARDLAER
ncbi:MAG: amidohydrolase family protein [Candidatus Bipolaricaulota bacterium]|nr:amidohydrolase family protein [Candidatus Bipolaricaulota bacterium]